MRVVAHHSKFYDWEPVPSDVVVTDADKAAGRVKPMARGVGWLMKVTKEPDGGTHTQINIPEHQIVAKIVHEKTRPEGGRTFTRKEAVSALISENVLLHHAHKKWLTKFEVHDDQAPDVDLLKAALAPHVADGTIEAADVDAHVAAYTESAVASDHAAHLHSHFKVAEKKS